MAYSELIKSFSRIRSYMRLFISMDSDIGTNMTKRAHVAMTKNGEEWKAGWGDYMCFRQDADGKSSFLSIDSRAVAHNPLYRVFKAKSFTGCDIMLHFQLLDILEDTEELSITEIMDELAERLNELTQMR